MVDDNGTEGGLGKVWKCEVEFTTSPVQAEVIPRLVGIGGQGSDRTTCLI